MKKVVLLVMFALVVMTGCDNLVSRKMGGTTTVNLHPGQRLVEVTWKENSLWYLTEPMDSGYVPKTKTFQEDSNFGLVEGTVKFVETR